MTREIDPNACPFCQQSNQCEADNPEGCWCFTLTVPAKMYELVPVQYKDKSCICRTCVTHFNLDPVGFIERFNGKSI